MRAWAGFWRKRRGGFKETKASIANKLSRATVSTDFS
jgi:hypothetical protein